MATIAECSSSDSDDEEYIPEGLPPSSPSDVSDGEPEVGVVKRGQVKTGRRSRRRKTNQRLTTRKKQGGILLDRDIGGPCDSGDSGEGGECDVSTTSNEHEKEKVACSRIDDLWASFKQDVGMKKNSSFDNINKKTVTTDNKTGGTVASSKVTAGDGVSTDKQPKTVSIKKTYDFAGEEIEIEKEVAADSKEAMKFFQSGPSNSANSLSECEPKESLPSSVGGMHTGTKRKGSGLSSVLQSIGKKQKLSTLEKSRLDWHGFKTVEGLHDELAHSTKDGYLAKQEFLQRTDLRQFELEKEQRLKRFKKLH